MIYPPGHDNVAVKTIIDCLDDWARAIDDGSVTNRQPSVTYVRHSGEDDWSEEDLDIFVRNLDYEFDQEVTRAPGTGVGAVRGPGFVRLAYEQRIALAQELDSILAAIGEEEYPSSTKISSASSDYWKKGDYVSPEHVDGYPPDKSYYGGES